MKPKQTRKTPHNVVGYLNARRIRLLPQHDSIRRVYVEYTIGIRFKCGLVKVCLIFGRACRE